MLRSFKWAVAPAPVLDRERNNAAVFQAVARKLAARVRAEFDRPGFEASPQWLEGIEHELHFWLAHFATEGIECGGRAVIDRLLHPHPFQYEGLFGEAPAYGAIVALFGLAPPVATEFGLMERPVGQFSEGSFDLVHARNALDHA